MHNRRDGRNQSRSDSLPQIRTLMTKTGQFRGRNQPSMQCSSCLHPHMLSSMGELEHVQTITSHDSGSKESLTQQTAYQRHTCECCPETRGQSNLQTSKKQEGLKGLIHCTTESPQGFPRALSHFNTLREAQAGYCKPAPKSTKQTSKS